MTDRDHFAAAALTGLLATGQGPYHPLDYFAKAAYEAADAMLRKRSSTNLAEIDIHLTDEERQAVRYMIAAAKFGQRDDDLTEEHAAALRGLLERTQTGEK